MTAAIVTPPEVEDEIRAINAWWRENRTAAPNLFAEELAVAFDLLRGAPHVGRRYRHPKIPNIRRLLLRATRYHVYYSVDRETVVVLAVWSAVRGTGPILERLS